MTVTAYTPTTSGVTQNNLSLTTERNIYNVYLPECKADDTFTPENFQGQTVYLVSACTAKGRYVTASFATVKFTFGANAEIEDAVSPVSVTYAYRKV